jgi:hypothetical protein
MGRRVMSDSRTIRSDGQQNFAWEWVWDTEETYSEFNFHDYSKPYQEIDTVCGAKERRIWEVLNGSLTLK